MAYCNTPNSSKSTNFLPRPHKRYMKYIHGNDMNANDAIAYLTILCCSTNMLRDILAARTPKLYSNSLPRHPRRKQTKDFVPRKPPLGATRSTRLRITFQGCVRLQLETL